MMKQSLLTASRTRILVTLLVLITALFMMRLFHLQVLQHDYYVGLADEEQLKKEAIPAARGVIYAMNGDTPTPLAMNETVYTVFADPAVVEDKSKVVKVMNDIAGGNVRDNFDDLLDKTDTRYQIIATKLTRVQAEKVKEKGLYGIGFQAESQRVYPEGTLASQVLGFVNTEGEGRYGIEGYMNDELEGTDGRLQTVTDVSDVPLTIGDRNVREAAVDGKNVVMTLDRNVQSYVEEALANGLKRTGADEGSVIVMDPNTGEVLAMANLPSYDPSKYYDVSDIAVFNNGAISAAYEPGSDIKTYTMATGIDKGVVRASDTFYNTDTINIDGWSIGNATKGLTGSITFQTALQWSLNTGFVTVAQRLGDGAHITSTARKTMYEYFHDHFGLGQLTGIELANESAGVLYSPDDQQGNAVRYATMSFGQGMNATLVQVAAGFSAIINGGNYYKPTIVGGEMTSDGFRATSTPTPIREGVVKESTSSQMREMMETARRESSFSASDKSGYNIGGKTGTSQVAKEDGTGYKDNETVATYLGYGGADTPEYVIMVSLSGEGKELGGAKDALPVFTDISNWLIDYLKIEPKG